MSGSPVPPTPPAAVAVAIAAGAQQPAAAPFDRARYRDRKRVLVLFAPAAGDSALGAEDAARGRPAWRFTVVLVGKDGHVALRSHAPAVAARLFPVIDAMPMRRAEMARRRERSPGP